MMPALAKWTGCLLLGLTLAATAASAEDIQVGSLKISAPWARATPKSATVGGGYLTITNTGTAPDWLTGGSSSVSRAVEVHQMSMSGNVMKMRQLAGGVEIKPGETVELEPGGTHLMFVGLKQQLAQGQHFKATLTFEKAGKVDVDIAIAGIGSTAPGGAAMPHGHGGKNTNMNMK
jgi:copper(I)-binding protein